MFPKHFGELAGSNVLITGGTGSFGKKITEILLRECTPRRLVLFSRDEQKHVDLSRNFFPQDKYPCIRYFVGDVRDSFRLKQALRDIDYVIHAAAMKHVDMAEYNPQECIRTNIGGAENVINACIEAGVKKVVALSTDKAANPINLYGATKLCSDKLFTLARSLSGRDGCRFSVVRYGNVFGSQGSVVPFFLRRQSEGVLPITDDKMTRFFITLEQAVHFVLMAFDRMEGGELFVPKIPSAKLTDLAKAIAPQCRQKIIGLRPGEKLHECMIPADEAVHTHEFESHFIVDRYIDESSLGGSSAGDYIGRVPDQFSYTSDNNTKWFSISQLRDMVQAYCVDPHAQQFTGKAA